MNKENLPSDDDILDDIFCDDDEKPLSNEKKKRTNKIEKPAKVKGKRRDRKKTAVYIIEAAMLVIFAFGVYLAANHFKDYWAGGGADDSKTYEAGTYLAGQDIKEGVYLLVSSNGNSYVQVSDVIPATLDSMKMNAAFTTNRYVEVKKGEYITAKDATLTPLDDASAIGASSDGRYYDGMYLIGKDIPAGSYELVSTSDIQAYVEVLKDATGQFESLLYNASFSGSQSFTFEEGQYIKITRCAVVTAQ